VNATTQDAQHTDRFIATTLRRHHGDARAALQEAKEMRVAGEYGRSWWSSVTAELAYRVALDITARKGA
jgi:hypothetical protein